MKEDIKYPICHRCKKPIKDIAYILLSPAIVLQKFFSSTPPVFKCPEQAADYTNQLILHDDCFMSMLKEYGFKIADMKKLAKEYAEKELKRLKEEGD